MLSTLYAAAARRRREHYAARPDLRRRLRHPVISIGNLAVGGRGKTPLAATVARLLRDGGERPAILSRGYGRARQEEGVVVVRDRDGIRADLARSGDEPLMLARQLPGVCVLTCPDRYLSGRFAEHHLSATVHILDDGFQHLQLERDIDLLIVGGDDVRNPVTLPAGRLREPLDAIVAADAILTADEDVAVDTGGLDLPVYRLRRRTPLRAPDEAGAIIAVAGIAAPARFFDDLRAAGWHIAEALTFPDHHRYTARDVDRMTAAARGHDAVRIMTTEKDYVRLLPFRPFAVPVQQVPLVLEPDPIDRFRDWLAMEVAAVRGDIRG
ncbi:MAG: tetraacyldisaccharide 4'-kinase [Vicinamibacterales bacterium]